MNFGRARRSSRFWPMRKHRADDAHRRRDPAEDRHMHVLWATAVECVSAWCLPMAILPRSPSFLRYFLARMAWTDDAYSPGRAWSVGKACRRRHAQPSKTEDRRRGNHSCPMRTATEKLGRESAAPVTPQIHASRRGRVDLSERSSKWQIWLTVSLFLRETR